MQYRVIRVVIVAWSPLAISYYRSIKSFSCFLLVIFSLLNTQVKCCFTVLWVISIYSAISLFVHPLLASMAMVNSVVVRLSATSSLVSGLWIRLQPAAESICNINYSGIILWIFFSHTGFYQPLQKPMMLSYSFY